VVLPPALALFLTVCSSLAVNLSVLLVVTGGAALRSGLGAATLASAVAQAVLAIPGSAVSAFFLGGAMHFFRRIVLGEKPVFADVFAGARFFGPAFVVSLATVGAASALGALLRLAPIGGGLVAFLLTLAGGTLWPWAMAAVVRGRPGMAALQEAVTLVSASPGSALALLLLGGLGVFACCLGMFVTMPIAFLAVSYAYARGAGEPLAPAS
jgi:hypothetical protein